jgi:integrase/recombinase XerD
MSDYPRRLDLAALLESWETHLLAERKSIETVRLYGRGVRAYLAWCQETDHLAALDRPTVAAFVADLLASGREAATAHAYQKGLRQFSRWLAEEGELPDDPLLGVRPPKLDSKVVPVLDAKQLKALVAACQGPTMLDRRDEALIRFLAETGARAGETVALALEDVDVRGGAAVIRRGKGGRGRMVPFSPQTARALDRYLRLRRHHPRAASADLWVGDRGKRFGYAALRKVVVRRGELAGIKHLHPHMLRHTAAHRWLQAGGTEGGLLAIGGWSNRSMLDRYGSAVASERAADEARRLGLGDL